MITPQPIICGLGGAIGSAYDQPHNRIYFTEFNGKLSRLDLTPGSGSIVRSSDAHTFVLTTWDRTINGYSYIHRRDYHKSITLLLP